MTMLTYFKGWYKCLDLQELYNVTNKVNSLYKTKCCEPEYKNIFKVFNITDYDNTKLIFLAQDPYPQKNIANGIAFGNKVSQKILSPSLNILKEAVINFEIPHKCVTFDQTLEEWSKQGVLLLNTSLSVEVNKPGSHSIIWRPFIAKFLQKLSEWNPGLIYVLWGNQAKSFKMYINHQNNTIIEMNHPAWYAREHKSIPPSFFVNLNKLVKKQFGEEINWYNEF